MGYIGIGRRAQGARLKVKTWGKRRRAQGASAVAFGYGVTRGVRYKVCGIRYEV